MTSRFVLVLCGLCCLLPLTAPQAAPPNATLGLYSGRHDSCLALAVDGDILVLLHLETVFVKGQLRLEIVLGSKQGYTRLWTMAYKRLQGFLKAAHPQWPPRPFGVLALAGSLEKAERRVTRVDVLRHVIPHHQFLDVDHHVAHAHHAFYDSPFSTALIVTCDGGGNDGYFKVFWGTRHNRSIALLGSVDKDLGRGFAHWSSHGALTKVRKATTGTWVAAELMHLASRGTPRAKWQPLMERIFAAPPESWSSPRFIRTAKAALQQIHLTGNLDLWDYAATAQRALEQTVIAELQRYAPALARADGVALGGGVAANFRLTTAVREHFGAAAHVPFSPGDAGLPVGAAWAARAPAAGAHTGPYLGLPLLGAVRAAALPRGCRPRRVTAADVAALLGNGTIVAVVRGRPVVGQGALGERSVLALPLDAEVRRAVMRVARRPLYHYTGTLVLQEHVREVFERGEGLRSPHMSFVAQLREPFRERYAAVADANGYALVQTVGARDSGRLRELLRAVRRGSGSHLVMSVPLPVIVPSVAAALHTFGAMRHLPFMIIEDQLLDRDCAMDRPPPDGAAG